MLRLVRSSAFLFALIVCALPLAAESWDQVQSLRPGTRVKVRETGGPEHKGTITAVTADSISLAAGPGQVSVSRNRIDRIQVHGRSRRLRNAAIGAAIGVAVGVTVDQTLGVRLRNESNDSGRAITYIAPIGLFTGLFAARSSYRTVYSR